MKGCADIGYGGIIPPTNVYKTLPKQRSSCNEEFSMQLEV